MRYFDSSALVKQYLQEDGSARVRRLARGVAVATSRLSAVEIASALARRQREGSLPAGAYERALTALARDSETWTVVELTPGIAHDAGELVRSRELSAGDAIQLSSCLSLQRGVGARIELVAFDERLVRAARAEGVVVRDSL